ncbi:MAG: hypothetical protein ABIX12_02915, partial [Rubrivivax sp.]
CCVQARRAVERGPQEQCIAWPLAVARQPVAVQRPRFCTVWDVAVPDTKVECCANLDQRCIAKTSIQRELCAQPCSTCAHRAFDRVGVAIIQRGQVLFGLQRLARLTLQQSQADQRERAFTFKPMFARQPQEFLRQSFAFVEPALMPQ